MHSIDELHSLDTEIAHIPPKNFADLYYLVVAAMYFSFQKPTERSGVIFILGYAYPTMLFKETQQPFFASASTSNSKLHTWPHGGNKMKLECDRSIFEPPFSSHG